MDHKVRLGPIAIFLTVVAIILSTLSILSVATTNADMVLAERFAAVTKERYALEAKGERFLKTLDEQAQSGRINEAGLSLEKTKNGYRRIIMDEKYWLDMEVAGPDESRSFKITKWEIKKKWKEDDPYENVWKGVD